MMTRLNAAHIIYTCVLIAVVLCAAALGLDYRGNSHTAFTVSLVAVGFAVIAEGVHLVDKYRLFHTPQHRRKDNA